MKEIHRKSSLPDARLYEHGTKVTRSLEEDIEDFSTFDSTIDEKFINSLQGTLDGVRDIKKDDVMVDEQAQHTDEVNRKMAACNKGYKTVAYFVRYVFDDDESIQNEFGLNDIKGARNNQSQMIFFMTSLAKTAAKYKDQLIKGGMNPDTIDALPRLAQELDEANQKQEQFKDERGKLTQERIQRVNALYDPLARISDIARIIYADDPAQLNKYQMPTPDSSTNSEEDLITS
ncbi:MAG: hypothetical protein ACQER7_10735 [Bacteroidota bacterium]